MYSHLVNENDLNDDNPESCIAYGILDGRGLSIDEVCLI